MSTFDSTKTQLSKLLDEIAKGKIQLPDFQRGWVWDDEHIRSLLVRWNTGYKIASVVRNINVYAGLQSLCSFNV